MTTDVIKKRCLFGPNTDLAYTPGEECEEGETFLPDFCDCQLFAEAECSCGSECPAGKQCINGECVSSYWIWEGRTYNGTDYVFLEEADWQSGGSFTPIQLTDDNQWPTVYVSNQIGTASPQLTDATPLGQEATGTLDGGSCTGDAITFYVARVDTNYSQGDALYVQQAQALAIVPCAGSNDPEGDVGGEWHQADASGNKL